MPAGSTQDPAFSDVKCFSFDSIELLNLLDAIRNSHFAGRLLPMLSSRQQPTSLLSSQQLLHLFCSSAEGEPELEPYRLVNCFSGGKRCRVWPILFILWGGHRDRRKPRAPR